MHFWKPHIYSNKLDVQEANSCVTQQHRSRNYLIGRWFKIGRNSCAQFVGLMTDKRLRESVDYGSPNSHIFSPIPSLFVFEDNDAATKMILKVRSPCMTYVPNSSCESALVV